jgi:hypothetical protein
MKFIWWRRHACTRPSPVFWGVGGLGRGGGGSRGEGAAEARECVGGGSRTVLYTHAHDARTHARAHAHAHTHTRTHAHTHTRTHKHNTLEGGCAHPARRPCSTCPPAQHIRAKHTNTSTYNGAHAPLSPTRLDVLAALSMSRARHSNNQQQLQHHHHCQQEQETTTATIVTPPPPTTTTNNTHTHAHTHTHTQPPPTRLHVLAVLVHVGAARLCQNDVVAEVVDLHQGVVEHLLRV